MTTTTMMMMRNSSHDLIIPTTTTTWKLYSNPFFNHTSHRHHLQLTTTDSRSVFFNMEENRIKELKAELDHERRSRKKVEILNKKLARELAEERRGREALVKVCENLARKIAADKSQIDSMEKEMEEERKMLRMAEALREERVQMKLSDARMLWEEKMSSEGMKLGESAPAAIERNWESGLAAEETTDLLPGEFRKLNLVVGCGGGGGGIGLVENHHIRRGIRGFVEFPRMVHRIGSRSGGKHWGTKLECQKAQLRILLKQRSPIRSNTFIIS